MGYIYPIADQPEQGTLYVFGKLLQSVTSKTNSAFSATGLILLRLRCITHAWLCPKIEVPRAYLVSHRQSKRDDLVAFVHLGVYAVHTRKSILFALHGVDVRCIRMLHIPSK